MAEMTAILTDTLMVKFSRAISTVLSLMRSLEEQAVGERARPEELSLNSYVLLQAYILMAVTGLGYLALTWSTVVLLGGFVTSLGNKDFWCLTCISMVQAARIFNDSGDNLFPIFLNLMENLSRKAFTGPREHLTLSWYLPRQVIQLVEVIIIQISSLPALVVVLMAGILYKLGPVACIVLSLWRLWQHDYCNTACDDNKANLVPALYIFYCLVIGQGVLFFIWWLMDVSVMRVMVLFREECQLPEKWGSITISGYLYDTRAKCWRDPTSIDGMNLINYAVDLVDSESQKDYLSGARMLDNFIKMEADVRSLLLPSRPKIQKLIDTLGWRSSNRELREVVARIVAYLAGDIHLSQFPGAIHCISLLLDTTLPYWNNQQGPNHATVSESEKDADSARERFISLAKEIEECRGRRVAGFSKKKSIFVLKRTEDNKAKIVRSQGGDIRQDGVDSSTHHGSKEDGWNELILQGLTILERLVFDQHNCNDICNTPGLLPKIMAPLYSETLIQDINANQWADVVNGSLKVVHMLIRAPDWIGKSDLVHKICSNGHALSNLERILYQGKNDGTELQMRAIEILTELATDSSANLSTETKENLIRKQLQIFLTDDEGDKDGLNKKNDDKGDKGKLRVTAGKSLALLSKMETVSKFIKNQQNSIADCPNEILDTKNDITYRTVALEILENLCTHCTLDKDYVKETLLPKVLTEVLASTRDLPKEQREERKMSAREKRCARRGNDEEKQLTIERSGQIKKSPDKSSEELKAEIEYREALLSLTFVMCECDKLISVDDFDDVVRKISLEEGAFVGKLRAIVEENCEDRADCLRIVKLCGQIAVLMLQPGQDTVLLNEFLKSLENASKILSNLESCMLFAGTDCGVKKTARPLLSDLVEKVRNLVGNENVTVIG
ncbi:hypothetical protein CFC21_013807 [Triticum aestivum]|uniref:Uncharacterized protein n=2 Tax=Triticum aestivum TaxID=4565 RepID=A0A3B6A2S3_WHEAT|nr:uncharacterized protein LOC123183137 [Triticum aestivum]KAF6997600.1 hypothetical protein CFC21_013807 [Triticum aestivum]